MSSRPMPLVKERELTVRGVLLGMALTLIFTAANVYLGLRVGLTFATSIPAAVISMAALRMVRNAGILENNIVQTVASAAGTLAAIAFVVPGLVMIGWWAGFPYVETFFICLIGGAMGVFFSVPLRRALVTGSDLPYPEGVAAAEVLKVGVGSREGAEEGRAGLRVLALSSVSSALFAAIVGTRLFAAEVSAYFRVGAASTGGAIGLSLALLGAGHLVGISVGMAMFLGLIIAWGVATPILSIGAAGASASDIAQTVWAEQVRFIGAGAIGIASLWTLATLAKPIMGGLISSAAASRARKESQAELPIEERDMPIGVIASGTLLLLVPMAILLHDFLSAGPLAAHAWPLIIAALVYVLLAGAFVASVCGYMAGLIGASNSPLSGVGILAILGAAVLLSFGVAPFVSVEARPQLIAFALFVTAIIFAAATIANDNLQDLKTGQLVGATPWRQQVALLFGVLAGAIVIPLVLSLLNSAYGFASIMPGAPTLQSPLPAPQATLIATLARGVIGGDLDWSLIAIGGVVGAGLLLLDALLGKLGLLRLPPLAVGIGIYLPATVTAAVVIGAVTGYIFDRRAERSANPEPRKRMGVLMASGLIVGESLFGVALAGMIVATGSGAPIALVGDGFGLFAALLGLLCFAGVVAWNYRKAARAG